jgi:hypothetical protein
LKRPALVSPAESYSCPPFFAVAGSLFRIIVCFAMLLVEIWIVSVTGIAGDGVVVVGRAADRNRVVGAVARAGAVSGVAAT